MIDDRNAKSPSKYGAQSATARLVSAEKNMLHKFPELGEGKSVLTRDWIEYVLAKERNQSFRTRDGPITRGEIEERNREAWDGLALAAAPRGNWGPW